MLLVVRDALLDHQLVGGVIVMTLKPESVLAFWDIAV
jgi:hypothetical protein